MKNTCLLVHCILSFESTSYKKIQDTASLPVPLFLVFTSHQLLHQQISFFTTFQNLIQHFLKKDFHREFSFFNGFNSPSAHPLNSQNPLSVKKVFCRCSLNLENFWFYIQVGYMTSNFTTQMTLRYLLLMPMNKKLECKDRQIYSKIMRNISKK